MNVLVLSCGTRNKIIRYFRHALSNAGKVIAADSSPFAPALYEANAFYVVPKITEEGYLEKILRLCRDEKIDGILSLIDPELSVLAKNKKHFKEIGTTVVGSDYVQCERCLDKWEMYRWMREHGYYCAKTYKDCDSFSNGIEQHEISYPIFAKPRFGSGSQSVFHVTDEKMLEFVTSRYDDMLFQQHMHGEEIGVDCYVDMSSHQMVSVFAKRKLTMRAGETDKAVSFKDGKLFDVVEKFVTQFGLVGQIDIDLFCNNGEYFFSEINPRFGGGYPHAYESGVNHMEMIIRNLNGSPNEPSIGCYREGVYMLKYNDCICIDEFGANECLEKYA